MNPTPTLPRPLDSYETVLLDDLRREVHRRQVLAPLTPGVADAPPLLHRSPQRGRPARRIALVGVGLAGAVAAIILPAILGGSPAYALAAGPDGSVTVTINRPEDAADLQSALAARGLSTRVDYLSRGWTCDPDRFRPARFDAGTMNVTSIDARTTFTVSRSMATGGRTAVVTFAGDETGGSAFLGVAEGAVGPCGARRDASADPPLDPTPTGPFPSAAPESSAPPAPR